MRFFLAVLIAMSPLTGAATLAQVSWAQEGVPDAADPELQNPPPPKPDAQAEAEDTPKAYLTYKTPYEYHLTTITVMLGLGMALLLCVLHYFGAASVEVLRALLLIMIIFASLFLIVAGYSDKQTAPVFGLLGTILGYLFGRTVGDTSAAHLPPAQDAPSTKPPAGSK
jgi:amino acid transporter